MTDRVKRLGEVEKDEHSFINSQTDIVRQLNQRRLCCCFGGSLFEEDPLAGSYVRRRRFDRRRYVLGLWKGEEGDGNWMETEGSSLQV